jgi:uncharacterized protein YrzB (UPF0473 family)
MKENKIVIDENEQKKVYKVLLKVEDNDQEYIIYTADEQDDCGEILAYAATYEFKSGHQIIKPIEDECILEFLDGILLQIQNNMNKESEINE